MNEKEQRADLDNLEKGKGEGIVSNLGMNLEQILSELRRMLQTKRALIVLCRAEHKQKYHVKIQSDDGTHRIECEVLPGDVLFLAQADSRAVSTPISGEHSGNES